MMRISDIMEKEIINVKNGKKLGFITDIDLAVSICLKIGQIFHFRIFTGKETFTFLQLSSDRLLCPAIIRIKGLVITIGTTAPPFRPVTVRTSETRVQRNLLYFIGKILTQKSWKIII